MILTADLHLTDNEDDGYRWVIFDHLFELARDSHDTEIVILGDLTDRKDRHSAELVNRLIDQLAALSDKNDVTILMGNHDMPINGRPFWQFLGHMGDASLRFITKPTERAGGAELYLPYASNPFEAWSQVNLAGRKAIFMHQTVTGAAGNNGHVLENKKMPVFPRGPKIYSGDIHVPQKVGSVTYVGAPHPIKFGDDYPCRILRLDSRYAICQEVPLTPPAKRILRASSMDEIERASVRANDRIQVFYSMPIAEVDQWPAIQARVQAWAEERHALLASIEPVIIGRVNYENEDAEMLASQTGLLASDATEVIRAFAESEGIGESSLNYALALLTKNMGAI